MEFEARFIQLCTVYVSIQLSVNGGYPAKFEFPQSVHSTQLLRRTWQAVLARSVSAMVSCNGGWNGSIDARWRTPTREASGRSVLKGSAVCSLVALSLRK